MAGNRARAYRGDAVWILGVVGAILLSAIRPELDHPHDYWAAAIGANCLFAGICLYLYDVLHGRGWTLGTVFGAMALISIALADSWTHDFRRAQVIVVEKSPPQSADTSIPQPQLQAPRFHEHISTFVLTVGAGGVSISTAVGIPIDLGGYVPFRFSRMADDTISVDVRVWGGAGLPLIEIKGDDFVVRPPDWDRNMSENALEVVDDEAKPVFQFIHLTPGHILVNGIFAIPGGGFLLAGGAGMAFAFGKEATIPANFTITPIFRYPSWKYPGVYVKP